MRTRKVYTTYVHVTYVLAPSYTSDSAAKEIRNKIMELRYQDIFEDVNVRIGLTEYEVEDVID